MPKSEDNETSGSFKSKMTKLSYDKLWKLAHKRPFID
jgi:hypothetical protein